MNIYCGISLHCLVYSVKSFEALLIKSNCVFQYNQHCRPCMPASPIRDRPRQSERVKCTMLHYKCCQQSCSRKVHLIEVRRVTSQARNRRQLERNLHGKIDSVEHPTQCILCHEGEQLTNNDGKKLKIIVKIEDVRYVKMKNVMMTIPHLMILSWTSMSKPFSHAIRGYSCIGISPGPEEITTTYGQFRRYSLACTKRKCMDSIYIHFFGPSNILSQGYCTCSDRRLRASKLSHRIQN